MLELPHPKQDRKKAPRKAQSHRQMAIPFYHGRWPFIGSNKDCLREMAKSWLSATPLIIEAISPAVVPEPGKRRRIHPDAAPGYPRDNPLRTVAIAASIFFVVAILAR